MTGIFIVDFILLRLFGKYTVPVASGVYCGNIAKYGSASLSTRANDGRAFRRSR